MDDITKTGIQYVADDIKEQLIGDAQFLMNAAVSFIKKLENIANSYEHLQNQMRLGGKENSLSRIRQVMQQSQNGLKEAIIAQYTFEQQVNNFLGRQIHLAWVDIKTGEIFLARETSAKQIYTLVKPGKGLSGNIKIKNVNKFKEKISSLPSFVQKQYEDLVNKRVMSHQGLFRAVISRLEDNSDKNNHPWYDKHKDTVYWQHPPQGIMNEGKWSWSIPTKKGFISQGYIRLIFNSMENLEEVSEYNIGHFMINFIEKNDNIPGVVKGDIVVKNTNDTVQIAVKSNTFFSTASIGPYITVAYQIIQFYDKLNELNVEQVGLILKNLQTYRPAILALSQKNVQEKLKKIFEESGAKII